mgnify:CR=1 FL=1
MGVFSYKIVCRIQHNPMSGDYYTHNDQQPPLPVEQQRQLQQRCAASMAMDEIKESRWIDTNYTVSPMAPKKRFRRFSLYFSEN